MPFGQSSHKRARAHLAPRQPCDRRFVVEPDETGVEPAFEQPLPLFQPCLIEEVHSDVGKQLPEAADDLGNNRVEQAPDIADIEAGAVHLGGLASGLDGAFALFEHGAGFREKRAACAG